MTDTQLNEIKAKVEGWTTTHLVIAIAAALFAGFILGKIIHL